MNNEDLYFEIIHLGINCKDEESASNSANLFEKYFNLPKQLGKDSIFSSSRIELMKNQGYGENGHIAMGTDNILKAKEYLESLGLEFIDDSIKYDEDGEMLLIYLKEEIEGFAIHLLQNKK